MIRYRFNEEQEFALYYAKKLDDALTLEILQRGEVLSAQEAQHLSSFFWKMVDASIEDENNKVRLPWVEKAEFWTEKIMNSFGGYLERNGYEDIWEAEVDKQP